MVLGQVKWFNAKGGFGFVTALCGEYKGKDVFVHHSGVKTSNEQFRYLVEGEYVEVEVTESVNGEHKIQCMNVTGVEGGSLMCEVRYKNVKKENNNVVEQLKHKPKSDI